MFGKKDAKTPDSATLVAKLETITDPRLKKSLGELKWLEEVKVEPERIRVALTLPTPAWAPKAELETMMRSALEEAIGSRSVEFAYKSNVERARGTSANDPMPTAKNIILLASGKGGVGKSTVAANMAAALAYCGAKVGLLDADIYGPSIPTMLGSNDRPEVAGQKLIPIRRHGIKLMSIGFIVKPEEAMVWRGPMLVQALTQFMRDVDWAELDYLIIDMPPGTGDVQLTIAQNLKVSGAVLVSTPQDVALADVVRGKVMFDKTDIPTLGVIENMSYFVCGDCGARHEIFSSGGVNQLAKQMDIPLLGEVPLDIEARKAADAGKPVVIAHPESASAQVFMKMAQRVATDLAEKAQAMSAKPSGLKIIQ